MLLSQKKVLVLGGTGAMGIYLVPELIEMGYKVDVVSLDNKISTHPDVKYICADALNDEFLLELLKHEYDAIVDYLIYATEKFSERHEMLLSNTTHYIYLSSYRVYANEDQVITEQSPQLLDVSDNPIFLATEDYSLIKARQEDILEKSRFSNWTIVRPAITFSSFRYQLVTLEANIFINRTFENKPAILPEQALDVQSTMSCAGDVAKMKARLLFNKNTHQEAYTLATAEHNTWQEVASYYEELIGLKYVTVDMQDYIKIMGGQGFESPQAYQLRYDRLFNRVVDNSKVLNATGMLQSELISVKEGLRRELEQLSRQHQWPGDNGISRRMDEYLKI